MWAAAYAYQFEEARKRENPRTIRGIYAKWKEIEDERKREEQAEIVEKALAEMKGQPDPRAKQRARLKDLTREALEDDIIGLTVENKRLCSNMTVLQAMH